MPVSIDPFSDFLFVIVQYHNRTKHLKLVKGHQMYELHGYSRAYTLIISFSCHTKMFFFFCFMRDRGVVRRGFN